MPLADDPDLLVKRAHVAVYGTGDPRACGGGVQLTGDRLLTCAHVVNLALGRPAFAGQPPAVEADGSVTGLRVGLPGSGEPRLRLRVALDGWAPAARADGTPAREGDAEWLGDLALLRLLDGPPHLGALPRIGRYRVGRPAYVWFGSGAPSTLAATVVQGVTEGWIVLDAPDSAQPVVEGYSGSPLWDRERRQVVALLVSRQGGRAFAIPIHDLGARFASLDQVVPGQDAHGQRRVTAAVQLLLAPARALLGSRLERADCAASLAAELDAAQWAVPADPDPRSIAELALGASHGVPTLLALLAARTRDERELQALYETGLRVAPEWFLTAGEHRGLLDLLELPGVPSPRAVVGRALPLGPEVAGSWPQAVAALEGLRGRRGGVPPLLRVVEFAACQVAGDAWPGGALAGWNDAVAFRLGVSAQLGEHRAQAQEAQEAAARARGDGRDLVGPVVQVQLWRAAGADAFSYTLDADDGRGFPAHRRVRDRPLPQGRLVAELGEVLEELVAQGRPGSVPVIEWFVEPGELDLPVDQWVYRPDELFPGYLGRDFLCVLRCPQLRRAVYRPELRYRWQSLRAGRLVVLERHDPDLQERGAPVPICAVVLACPPAEVPRLRAVALAVGVPGVLWLRPTASPHAHKQIGSLVSDTTPRQLPNLVHRERLGHGGLGGSLALVWDGPDRIPGTLRLGDPPAMTGGTGGSS